MARNKNLSQRYGSTGNNQLYESLSKIQSALTMAMRQGKLAGADLQASASLTVSNPVIRLRGNNTIINLYSPDFGCPIYIYSVDGCTFSSTGGNILNDVVMQPDEPAMAQYDRNRDSWFIYSGANGLKALANVGGGAEVYKSATWPTAYLRTLIGTDGVSLVQNANDITLKTVLTATQIAYGSATSTMTSEASFYRTTEDGLNVIKADSYWSKRSPRVNIKWFGATGNGSTDDTDAIQAAYTYAKTIGGVPFYPAGEYIIGKTAGTGLHIEDGVGAIGEGKRNTILKWRPYSGGAVQDIAGTILDTTNYNINRVAFEGIKFVKDAGVTAEVTGILGGCDLAHYNSGEAVFRDLWFDAIYHGIRGNGAGYVEGAARTIGLFDCTFDSITYTDCTRALRTGGSGNIHIRPFFISNDAALVMDYISTESFSGEQFLGGTWTQNYADIYFVSDGGSAFQQYRQTNFFGSWFEASQIGIILSGVAGIPIPVLNFQGCVLQSNVATAAPGVMLDGSLIQGQLTVNDCVIYKLVAADDDRILGGANTNLMIRDCVKFGTTGYPSMTFVGTDAGMMLIVAAAPAVGNIAAAGVTNLVWDVVGATPGMHDFDKETCFDGTSTYTAKYEGTYHASVNVMLDAFPVGESVDLRISKNGVVVAIFHQNGTTYDVSITIDATVNLAVGDTLVASVYNPDVAAKTQIVGTYGFTNPHYNTFKVNREF